MSAIRIPAVFARGGSSKGVIFHARDLPDDPHERDRLILRALGSPDPYQRQLDGLGGGISSVSKAVIIAPSQRRDADVDYTFAQVVVDRPIVDYGSMCGNMSAAVGPFAVDEGLVAASGHEAIVRIFNTNTRKVVHARFPIADGRAVEGGDFVIPGVPGTGACIRLDYISPGGSVADGLVPSGRVCDELDLGGGDTIAASLIDATNPVVFIRARDVGLKGSEAPEAIEADRALMARLDRVRRAGGVAMGIAGTPDAVGLSNPKVAIVSEPMEATSIDGRTVDASSHDITVRMISMERVHRAVTLTGAKCTACAAQVTGSLVHRLSGGAGTGGLIRIATPSGVLPVAAEVREVDGGGFEAVSATSYRTQRRIMEGAVVVPR